MKQAKGSDKMVVRGSPSYIKYLSSHLQKEHPETKGKVKIIKK